MLKKITINKQKLNTNHGPRRRQIHRHTFLGFQQRNRFHCHAFVLLSQILHMSHHLAMLLYQILKEKGILYLK
jgi:hypothetical protein